jgi:RNA methyltransferase, TrmH family
VEEPRLPLRELRGAGAVLILDGLQDPGNAGTLVRSLHATSGTTVLALKGTVDLFNPKVVRASAGSLFHLEVAARVEADETLAWLAARDLPLLALDAAGEPLFGGGFEAPARFALAVGNEGAGLSPRLIERAARRLAIPMASGVDSLNAAVAGSVALYELRRGQLGIDRRPRLS